MISPIIRIHRSVPHPLVKGMLKQRVLENPNRLVGIGRARQVGIGKNDQRVMIRSLAQLLGLSEQLIGFDNFLEIEPCVFFRTEGAWSVIDKNTIGYVEKFAQIISKRPG